MGASVAILEHFYTGLQNADIEAVRACYSPDIAYSDPVFGELRGERAIAMWEMFFGRDEPLRITYHDLAVDGMTGTGHWEARYVFSRTGRKVHNRIASQFRFDAAADGTVRIAEHHDNFSVYRWSVMALGPIGRVAGWTPPLRAALRKQSGQLIDRFQATRPTE